MNMTQQFGLGEVKFHHIAGVRHTHVLVMRAPNYAGEIALYTERRELERLVREIQVYLAKTPASEGA